jgi:long-chain acyl-CoA synthetase
MDSWLMERIAQYADRPAVALSDWSVPYADISALAGKAERALAAVGVEQGWVVALEADYSPGAIATLLALARLGAVVVPLTNAVQAERDSYLDISRVRLRVRIDPANDALQLERRDSGVSAPHPLIAGLAARGHPGLVLFSSGSTGSPKAALHDLAVLLDKFRRPRPGPRTLTFLLLDHIGGLNTLFHVLSNGGLIVPIASRDPDAVCAAIEVHRVELLPTSPTFLNLLLLSEAYARHDLSSLRRITYGTEVMPASTLVRLHEVLPGVELLQTYGLSEIGILRSRSRDSGSLWVQVGGEGYETKIEDGTLRVRARSAMLGYLNAPSPFDADGWLDTGDLVEVDGDWIRILGRRSEIVNVGGQKVFPAEVESVLLDLPGVRDVLVVAEPNPITGQVVTARFNLDRLESPAELKRRVRAFCQGRLAPWKVPVKVEVLDREQYSARFKRTRRVT